MTILAIILTAALLATLRTAHRLLRQRDAAAPESVRLTLRNDVLMDQLDAQIADTNRERDGRLRAEANVETLGHLVLAIDERSAS